MAKINLSPYEVYKIKRVAQQNPNSPEVIWAALAEMGDQYAQSALQGLTDPGSLYGQVIPNSNAVSGVPPDKVVEMKKAIAQGYVKIISKTDPNADGTTKLPSTGQIVDNYSNAAEKVGAPATAPIDVDIEVMNRALGLGHNYNWYSKMGGLGLDIDSRRISQAPPSALASVTPSDAFWHLAETGKKTLFSQIPEHVIPSLNGGEQAQLQASQTANSAMDDVFGVGPLTRNDKLTLHVMGKDWFGNGSEAAPAPERMFPQILEIPSQQSAVMGTAPILNALNPAYGGLSSQDIIQLYNTGAIPQTLDPDVFASGNCPAVTSAPIRSAPATRVTTNFLAPGFPAEMLGIPAGMLYTVSAPAVPAAFPKGSWR